MRKVGVVRFSFRVVVIPVFESTLANRGSPKRKGEVWAGDSFEGSAEDLPKKESAEMGFLDAGSRVDRGVKD